MVMLVSKEFLRMFSAATVQQKSIHAALVAIVLLNTLVFPASAQFWDPKSTPQQGTSAYPPNSSPSPNTTYPAQPSYGNPYPSSPNYSSPNTYQAPNTYGVSPGYSNNSSGYAAQQPNSIHGYVSTAPAGTSLSVTNATYLSSESAQVGDPVSMTLGYDLAMGGQVILPSGTQVQGQVVTSMPAGRTGRNGEIAVRFNRAILPDGRVANLSAKVVTADGTGIIRGGVGSSRAGGMAKNTLGGAALGGLSGLAFGSLVGGSKKWNEGLLWGSIMGAGAGLARAGLQRGNAAEMQPGQQLQLILDQPMTLPSSGSGTSPYGGGY
jgi:hypothetical protein